MEVYLLDENFDVVSVIAHAVSFKLTKRFFSHGDFTLTTRGGIIVPDAARYIYDPCSRTCALIEGVVRLHEEGTTLRGRTLEALLDRRVIYGVGNYTGSVEFAVRNTVRYNAVERRGIAGLILGAECGLEADSAVSTSWEVLSDWAYAALRPYGASYSISLNSVKNVPEFTVVTGVDRTRAQSDRPAVVFSEDMGGIGNADYEIDLGCYANTAYVVGGDKTCVTYPDDSAEGLERREIFVPAKDVNPEYFVTSEAYTAALERRGKEALARNSGKVKVTGIIPGNTYVFGKDYKLGDLCDVEFSDGRTLQARVTSVTYEYNGGGVSITPAFGDDEQTLRDIIRDEGKKLFAV